MKHIAGLTLIEVLIALAIVAIAMTAIVKATGQNVRGATYLKDKTIAMWVGQQTLNEARLGLQLPRSQSDPLKASTSMLGETYYWLLGLEDTPNKQIKKLTVQVFPDDPEDTNTSSLISMETYTYHAK